MFALFNLGFQEMIVLGIGALGLVIVMVSVLRPRGQSINPNDRVTPLERAKYAASVLTPEERETLRLSLEDQRPQSLGGEGIR